MRGGVPRSRLWRCLLRAATGCRGKRSSVALRVAPCVILLLLMVTMAWRSRPAIVASSKVFMSSCAAVSRPVPWVERGPPRPEEVFMSNIDAKLVSDFHYGALPQPPEYVETLCSRTLTSSNTGLLQKGDVVFVDSNFLWPFVTFVLPHIPPTTSFVLVTGDSDDTVPDAPLSHRNAVALARDPRISHWFSTNCGASPNTHTFSCIPNGVSQWFDQRAALAAFRERLPVGKRHSRYVLFSFNVENHPEERGQAWRMGCEPDSPLASVALCSFDRHANLTLLYHTVARSKFVVSPRGRGLDCYRTYEALLLGAYPIVKSSSLDPIFAGLPVLILPSWESLTLDVLKAAYARFSSREWDLSPLYSTHWARRFRSLPPQGS